MQKARQFRICNWGYKYSGTSLINPVTNWPEKSGRFALEPILFEKVINP